MQVETTKARATKTRINFTGLLIRMESPFPVFQMPAFTCHYNILAGEHGNFMETSWKLTALQESAPDLPPGAPAKGACLTIRFSSYLMEYYI